MPLSCLLCGKGYAQNVHLFGFPRDSACLQEWCRIVKSVRPKFEEPKKTNKICSDHFPENSYFANAELYKDMGISPPKKLYLLPTAVPSRGLNVDIQVHAGLGLGVGLSTKEQLMRPRTKHLVVSTELATQRPIPGICKSKKPLPLPTVEKEPMPISNETDVQESNTQKSTEVLSTESQTVVWDFSTSKSTQVSFMTQHSHYGIGNMPLLPQQIKGLIGEAIKFIEKCKDLTFSLHSWIGGVPTHLEVTRLGWYNYPCLGYVPVKVIVTNIGQVSMVVLFGNVLTEMCRSADGKLNVEQLCKTLKKLSSEGKHLWCPGLSMDEHYPGITIHKFPCLRQHSNRCQGFYLAGTNTPVSKLMRGIGICPFCNLQRRMSLCRSNNSSSPMRRKRGRSDSHCPISLLSPATKKQRLMRIKTARRTLRKKVQVLEEQLKKNEIDLNEEQSSSLHAAMTFIDANHKGDLTAILDTIDKENPEFGRLAREAWKRDNADRLECLRKDFSKDQKLSKASHHGNRWSMITYRLALAVYCRSPAAYESLRKFAILKLPSKSSLLRKVRGFGQEAGICHEHFVKEALRYAEHKDSLKRKNRAPISGEGVLIFDEVKVIAKVIWNSKSREFIGLASIPEEYKLLRDMYEPSVAGANYILQFIWRCLSSKYDVIGPYFALETSVDSKTLAVCLHASLRTFQDYGFSIVAVISDGAANNLSVLRSLLGKTGSFTKQSTPGECIIDTRFVNTFKPFEDGKISWIICPSHQLKSMINALHSSQVGGTRSLKKNGQVFGWQHIYDMKLREQSRAEKNITRFIPSLPWSYIDRDSWTKLNVTPARVMQQERVLEELHHYISGKPRPSDAAAVQETVQYLKACNLIFEQGLLSKEKVTSMDAAAILNIQNGIKYFQEWFQETKGTSKEEKSHFLAWQTFDLLRVAVYGFISFTEGFLNRNPGNYIIPVRINGSAIETLFSQYKAASGAKLSSVNYRTARKSVLIRSRTVHPENVGYRDASLHF